MSRHSDLPIILSHESRTGMMIFPNRKMGGRDFVIVGLNKEIPSGEGFELQDVEWTKAVLHFADINTMKLTAEGLMQAARKWEVEHETD